MLSWVTSRARAPACHFQGGTHLYDNGISSKHSSSEGVEHIVKGIVPWHNGTHLHSTTTCTVTELRAPRQAVAACACQADTTHHAQRMVLHPGSFVEHLQVQEACHCRLGAVPGQQQPLMPVQGATEVSSAAACQWCQGT